MHKHVSAAVIRRDEAESFLVVEELYDAYTHVGPRP
jgi:hypothetical protein